MCSNRDVKKKLKDDNSPGDFDFLDTEINHKFIVKCSPQNEFKLTISRNRDYEGGPKVLSKSVPRKNRSLIKCKINRSLNFDAGSSTDESLYKLPAFNSLDTPLHGMDRHLTRSAKIMRSLNLNYGTVNIESKSMIKSLNFDLIVSPGRAPLNCSSDKLYNTDVENNPSIKINKTLNFDSSSNDSNGSSLLELSMESTDENQNQTPSQLNRNENKSLNCLISSSRRNSATRKLLKQSPTSRNKLIKDSAQIPNLQAITKNKNNFNTKLKTVTNTASIPRNLLQDFHDDENNVRPSTPDNVVQLVPESMKAIKKSHKKERLTRRGLDKSFIHQSEIHPYQVDTCIEEPFVLSQSGDRPATPILLNNSHPSPNYEVNSIKQSHKKDKSKKKPLMNNSEDEVSDSGSLFDYSEEQKNASIAECDYRVVSRDSNQNSSPISPVSLHADSDYLTIPIEKIHDCSDDLSFDDSERKHGETEHEQDKENVPITRTLSISSESLNQPTDNHETVDVYSDSTASARGDTIKPMMDSLNVVSSCKSEVIVNIKEELEVRNQAIISEEDTHRPMTPENHINFFERIISNSIKKSHKKIKDKKKQCSSSPFKRTLKEATSLSDTEIDDEKNNDLNVAEGGYPFWKIDDRASTPENVNSSRLLLAQYSSVKKSHKKNKYKNIMTESAKRLKHIDNKDESCDLTNSQSSSSLSSLVSLGGEMKSAILKMGTSILNESSDNGFLHDDQVGFQTPDESAGIKRVIVKSPGNDTSSSDRMTPNKRKKSFTLSETSDISSPAASHIESPSMEYASAEDEFKIFTPLKKRKSLFQISNVEEICMYNSPSKHAVNLSEGAPENVETSRCITPIMNQSSYFVPIGNDSVGHNEFSNMKFEEDLHPTPRSSEQQLQNTMEIANGRSTPQNTSTFQQIFDINSIKKSHKKDKRSNRLQRISLIGDNVNDICGTEQNECYTDTLGLSTESNTTNNSNYESFENQNNVLELSKNDSANNKPTDESKCFRVIDMENPQPSTSYETSSTPETERSIPAVIPRAIVTTPPNCMKAISFLKLRQTDSIKKSHKKNREKKRHSLTIAEPELSDDGSIFDQDDAATSIGMDSSVERTQMRDIKNETNAVVTAAEDACTSQDTTVKTPPNKLKTVLMTDSIKKSHKKVREFKRIRTRAVNAEFSVDDRSTFDSNEELEDLNVNSGNSNPTHDETLPSSSDRTRRTTPTKNIIHSVNASSLDCS